MVKPVYFGHLLNYRFGKMVFFTAPAKVTIQANLANAS